MRVFVYELVCAGGLGPGPVPASLEAEGRAMLASVVEDFARCAGVEVVTLLDQSFPGGLPGRCLRTAAANQESAFAELAASADLTLLIAPELDGLLAARAGQVVEAGGRLLGPAPEAIALTGDKLALGGHLAANQVPTPPTFLLPADDRRPADLPSSPACLKPRLGAGSQATFLVSGPEALAGCVAQARAEAGSGDLIVQPVVPGRAASIAFLVGPKERLALLPAAQHLSEDGRFRYLGGSLPLPTGLAARAERLARRAVAAVEGLRGYVGVDLVLGRAEDGSGDHVIEINPRLTTSYVGLRRLARFNLAGAMLRVFRGGPIARLGWAAGEVRFRADGTVLD